MPLNSEALALSASPRSVSDARRWVADICHRLNRTDLTECAELAVSELVTNALLHAEPPIALRVRGTREHPRIEVRDGSPHPPTANEKMTDDDELLSTIGRGLGIVAMCSLAWGSQIMRDGKVVWFVPTSEPRADADLAGKLVYDDVPPAPPPEAPENPVTIRIRQLPLSLYTEFRHRYRELRRELRLLSLASETSYPIAKSLSDLFMHFESEFRFGSLSEEVETAAESAEETVDLAVVIPHQVTATIAQMIDLLDLADAFCRTERLLSLAATPLQKEFQRWYLGEFVRQGRGNEPQPWTGATMPLANQNAS